MKLEAPNRIRSVSLGRNRDHKRRQRYWTFLFDHLSRIIDEIYQNCDEDESIDECREVILNLQSHIGDFESLIEWLKLNKDLESTPQRPSSVSWEVRKRFPTDPVCLCLDHSPKNSKVKRNLKTKLDEAFIKTTTNGLSKQVKEEKDSLEVNIQTLKNDTVKKINDSKRVTDRPVMNGTQVPTKPEEKKVDFASPLESHVFIRCNGSNETKISKCILDEDGFQMVRCRQRNKVTKLRIIDNNKESELESDKSNMIGDNLTPCRALQLHEKFSSPSRKRSVHDTLKKQEEKQAKAQEAREKFLEKKAEKFRDIVKKVEEIKAQKEEQQMQLKLSMEMRLQRADEKRQEQLNKIVRKAHDEDAKVNEILFINSLEADHKKHEIFSKEKVYELRLQDLQEERQRKLEEKASKEKAFEKRRKAIEAEKQARIEKLKEQRMLKVMKIQQQLQEKEKERQELAFQKELDRKSKISARNAQHAAEKEELQKKILAKQEESKRRHEENMEQIRHKALELSVKKSSSTSDDALVCVPYDTIKMCALCKVIIKSEVYLFGHLRGKKHNDAIREQNEGKIPSTEELENYNLKSIIDAPLNPDALTPDLAVAFQDCDSEKLKQARKKSKKLKHKLVVRANNFDSSYTFDQSAAGSLSKEIKYKFAKIIKELNTLHGNDRISGQWPFNMIRSFERALTDLGKILHSNPACLTYLHSIEGVSLFTKILSRILNGTTERPTSLTDNANNKLILLYKMCIEQFDICKYFFQSNNIITLLDILYHRVNICVNLNPTSYFPYDSVVGSLCELFSTSLVQMFEHYLSKDDVDKESMVQHIKEIINYVIVMGVIDKLAVILTSIRGSVNDMPEQSLFVKQIINLFSSIAKLLAMSCGCNFGDITYGLKLVEDDTQFVLTLRVNQLCGTVSLLYGLLLHSGAPVRDQNVPPLVPPHTLQVALDIVRFFNYIALLDINLIQSLLGGEGLSLQIRHICSYLIWYCSHHMSSSSLLNEVILLIGNFVVLNTDNQTLLQSGQRPTVVQQLCSLPFEYFSDESLNQILFPTLIVCCFNNNDNMKILKQEMSSSMLASFIEQAMVEAQLQQLEANERRPTIVGEKWSLPIRFPKSKWSEAKFYFEK